MNWTLHSGSCLDPVTGMASLADGSVDVAIFDPPYSEHVHGCSRRGSMRPEPGKGAAAFSRSRALGFESLTQDVMEACANEIARVVRRWTLVFCDVESSHLWIGALRSTDPALEYIRTGAWIKVGCTPQFTGDRPAVGFEAVVIMHPKGRKRWNGGGTHAVWSVPIVLNRGGANERLHTTQKPIALMERLVRDFTEPGELVLDPFAGSGTTAVACKLLGRRFVGWEKDARFHAAAEARIASTMTLAVLPPHEQLALVQP